MNILDMRVDWMLNWANSPELQLFVSDLPDSKDFVYEKRDFYYYAEIDGYVRLFYYREPGSGFGGTHFPVTLRDGTSEILKGPWDCGSCIHEVGFGPVVHVSYTAHQKKWESGKCDMAGYVTVAKARETLPRFLPDVELEEEHLPDRMRYFPTLHGMSWQQAKKKIGEANR